MACLHKTFGVLTTHTPFPRGFDHTRLVKPVGNRSINRHLALNSSKGYRMLLMTPRMLLKNPGFGVLTTQNKQRTVDKLNKKWA